jgi:hypothetical protein
VKGLSVRQPWAYLIAEKHKPIENRRNWCQPRYRGELAIQAAKGMTRDEYLDVADMLVSFFPGIEIPPFRELTRGAIVCVVTVIDCLEPHGLRLAYPNEMLAWWDEDQHGLVLDEVQALREPVPCSGMLGLWTVPPEIERQVRAQLGGAS